MKLRRKKFPITLQLHEEATEIQTRERHKETVSSVKKRQEMTINIVM